MMKQNALLAAIGLVVAFSFYRQSLGMTLTALGVGAIVYALSKSLVATLVVLALAVFIKDVTRFFRMREGMTDTDSVSANGMSANGMSANGMSANGMSANGMNASGMNANGMSANGMSANTASAPTQEGFQARDPMSIHHRIEESKMTPHKVQVVTGVLESASILNNTPLQGMQELANEGVPGSSIPASAKARVLIYPLAEDAIPAPSESMYLTPKDNPYLHNGQDRLAEEVAHAQKGTELYAHDSGSLSGIASGAGPAF